MILLAILMFLKITLVDCDHVLVFGSKKTARRNGVKEDDSSWYWDPPAQSKEATDIENNYKVQIRSLQNELSSIKERSTLDLRPETDEVNRLREENQNLTTSLEELDSQHQMAMEKLLSLKKELQKNFEVLKKEHEELKASNDEYTSEIKSLSNKVSERDKEIENLKYIKSDYDTIHHKYQNLERIHSLLRENAEKFQEENQDLHEEVFKLQEQVTKLEHDLEIVTKRSELSDVVPRERYDDLVKELNDLKGRRNSKPDLDEINIDDNAKSVIESLKREIHELKHQLSVKDLESGDHSDNKIIKSERVMQMYNKYVSFELPVDYVGEIPSAGDNAVLYKLENVFKTLNSFKNEIDSLKHELSQKKLNINHLQIQVEDLTTENDFLTTDINHFERELSETKKNNDFLISEIAALKNTSKLEPIIESHEDNLAKLETELADSNRMNKNFETEINRIKKQLAEVNEEKVNLQKSLNDLKEKYTTMLKEIEMCKNQTKAIEELENTTNTEMTVKLKTTTDEVDDLKKRLNASIAKNEQQSIDIHIIENDKVLLTKTVDDLKNALSEKSSEHKELEVLKIALDMKLHDLEVKLDEVIKHKSEVEQERNNLEEKLALLQFELSSRDVTELEFSKGNSDLALQEKIDQLSKDNATLLESKENVALLQQTIEELKAKLLQQDYLTDEVLTLKRENHKLVERQIQLEAELSSTDNKIVDLEQEFEKLISEVNEKDVIIDKLNSTIAKNNETRQSLTQNITDIENSVEVKNEEIKMLRKTLEEVQILLRDTRHKSNASQDELNKLQFDKEEIAKQLLTITDEIHSKNNEISDITDKLQESEKMCLEYKSMIESKDKNIKELNQSIVELTDKLKTIDNHTDHNDEYMRLVKEKEATEAKLKNSLEDKEKDLLSLKDRLQHMEKTCNEYKSMLDNALSEKNELINLVTMKHNESIQYHNEIQRLNHVILEQTSEFKNIIDEKEKLVQSRTECTNCDNLRITLKEKDEIIKNLNQNVSGNLDNVKAELSEAIQTISNLTEERDNMSKALAYQLETVKTLKAEILQLTEQEQNSTRELERLRHHLVEMEENYTQELMTSEQKLTECQTRLNQVEERAKQNSTVYTSNSIRANQEVETLRNQIKLLERQREEVQARLSEAEDARSKSEAALTNLQVVLEQFQLDKEREIHAATEKIRNKMEDMKHENSALQNEISRLGVKLEESLAGLRAATRLGDQVETKAAQINDLKEQVRTLQISVAAAEERYHNAISNQQDRVDKNLVKNLVINFVLASSQSAQNRTRVLKILSTVLDFNQQECEKLGLARSSNPSDGIAAEFVKFLENESRPRAPLPSMMNLAQNVSRSNTPPSRKSSMMGPNPYEVGHKRNPSTGSNNLLFQNLDTVETSSQISIDSDHREPRVVSQLDTGVNQTRNNEGAILKHVLKDM
ncbi:thyroid receptor-interacting protein 11-like isoform X2 [Plodia interpunctella]|uniref:thyroid receptor-interacting protein 11-like isoform X2 n=1 Tax=Plodia interpunctella TaxID=58824 RepID=UPI0023674735|nr:thyroid receptor-interacting protein 11-like isoform X2 [Plodia interpunctella]XP_053620601.1 thyroid receptor-interacting protein 11-like isoform X2 [Plodia interpunctella]XP_053620602.1 thyroid receptor-interacting protein 11-like isoform X2 [Plodia interpunctella]